MPRRRRSRFSPTLGGGMLSDVSNDANEARQDALNEYNRQAAGTNPEVRQYKSDYDRTQHIIAQEKEEGLAATKKAHDEKVRMHLLGAMGYETAKPKDYWDEETQRYIRPLDTRPSYDALQQNFTQLPTQKQVQLIQQGATPFLDESSSGKILSGWHKEQEGALHQQIGTVASSIAKGETEYDSSDRGYYDIVPDAMGGKTRKKVSIARAMLIQEGIRRGLLPDLDTMQGTREQLPAAAPDANLGATNVPRFDSTAAMLGNKASGALSSAGPVLTDMPNNVGTDIGNFLKMIGNAPIRATNAAAQFGQAFVGAPTGDIFPTIPMGRPSTIYDRRKEEELDPELYGDMSFLE